LLGVVALTRVVVCRTTSPSISPIRLPPRLEDVPEEGKGKAKEGHEVGEGDDTITIEDTSDDEDGETLQERFQLRSRFSRPGLPNIPLIVERPTSLEASLPALSRRSRNVARKHRQETEDYKINYPRGEFLE
jgi:hypothetical protein